MANSGMGSIGNKSPVQQSPVDTGSIKDAGQVGKSPILGKITKVDAAKTQGFIKTDGDAKHSFKFPGLLERGIKKFHAMGKTWGRAGGSLHRAIDQLKSNDLKAAARDAVQSHNDLVAQLEDLENRENKLEKEISDFKSKFGDALKFKNKKHPSSTDFKKGKSFVYPTANQGSERITFISGSKSKREEDVENLHEKLKNDPGIKARFSEHNQNKHELANIKEEKADITEKLYSRQKEMESTLSKAFDPLYKEQKAELKSGSEAIKEQVAKGYDSQRDAFNQGYQKSNQSLHAQYNKKNREKVEVRKLIAENKKALKEAQNKIDNFESRAGNLLAKAARKLMKEDQILAVFNEKESSLEEINNKKKKLIENRDKLKDDRKDLKAQEARLKEAQNKIENERFDFGALYKGSNMFERFMKEYFGIRVNIGLHKGGVLGDLKNKRDNEVDRAKDNYKTTKSEAKKVRNQNKKGIKALASGKVNPSVEMKSPYAFPSVFELRADTVLKKFSDNSFKQEQDWRSEITTMLDHAQLNELELIEDTLRRWTIDPENKGDYADVLEFINEQRNLRSS